MKHTLVVMMGPSGCGKSTLAKVIQDSHDDCVIVSRDAIRFAMLQEGEDYFKYEDDVLKKFYDNISRMLDVHSYVIADATHISIKARNELFRNIKMPSNCRIVGVWIEVPKEVALKQNAQRTGRAHVPESVIRNMYKYKVSPIEKEPFDDIIYISGHIDKAISKDNLCITSVMEQLKGI